jgi:hypothetical protein
MRIRTTTGPGASPPPGLSNSSNDQNHCRRIGRDALGVRAVRGHAGTRPLRPVVSVMSITAIRFEGDQW